MPSKAEGIGLSMIEGMICGAIPISCSDNLTAKEFSPLDFICKPDAQSIVNKIEELNKDYDYKRELALKFGEKYKIQFDKRTIAKNIINHGKLRLDPSQLECEWDGKHLPDKLTTTEFLIVQELAKRPGIIKERSQLMDIAYREDTDIEDRTIDSHVKRIRKKFKKVDNNFSAIETRYGSGYRWNVK